MQPLGDIFASLRSKAKDKYEANFSKHVQIESKRLFDDLFRLCDKRCNFTAV